MHQRLHGATIDHHETPENRGKVRGVIGVFRKLRSFAAAASCFSIAMVSSTISLTAISSRQVFSSRSAAKFRNLRFLRAESPNGPQTTGSARRPAYRPRPSASARRDGRASIFVGGVIRLAVMEQAEWTDRFRDVSAELARLAEAKAIPDDDVSEREGALLEILDDLEFLAVVKVKQGIW